MCVRTNPMKAVPLVLKHLARAEQRADLDDLKCELIKIKDLFSIVKKNEDELLDTLTLLYNYLRNSNIEKLMQYKDEICNRIRISTQKLLPADAIQCSHTQSPEDGKLQVRKQVNTALSSSPQLKEFEILKVNFRKLDYFEKKGALSLLRLPENAVMKKSDIFLWWTWTSDASTGAEGIFNALLRGKLIARHDNGKRPVFNKFKINPAFHHQFSPLVKNRKGLFYEFYSQKITSSRQKDNRDVCLVLDQLKAKLSDEFGFKTNRWRAIINVSASYLHFGHQWLSKMKHLEVLKLGRWLHDSPKHHIEVDSHDFLKGLRQLKDLHYLSLRGISGISELPPSIFQLRFLEVLDLKVCHNLETLPDDISSLKYLRDLDLSQCYLLDRMPKGIDKLTELRVLKGFLIGSSSNTPGRISDLVNLKRLERLSMHIGRRAVIQDREFERLKELPNLEHLKISWGVCECDTRYSDIHVIFPSTLRKLHLEGFPGQEIPNWLKPRMISRKLKELKITGGKLRSLNHGENNDLWEMEIVRLKYLEHLKVDLTNLQELFPGLRYAEIRQTPDHSYLEWIVNDRS